MKTLEKALYAKLASDGTLATLAPGGVWRGVAPTGTTGVFVVVSQVASVDEYTLPIRAWTAYTYDVKAVGAGETPVPVLDAAERIDTILTDASWTLDAGYVLVSRRQNAFTYVETDGGELYQHAGGTYRIEATA